MIGSLANPAGGQRPEGSTLEDDIENLNKNFTYVFELKRTPEGGTFQEMERGQNPHALFSIGRDSEDRPVITIRNWPKEGQDEYEMFIHGINGVIETLKYYSDSYEDGEAIYAYIDSQTKAGERITPESTGVLEKTFGNTKVKFEQVLSGITVRFLD